MGKKKGLKCIKFDENYHPTDLRNLKSSEQNKLKEKPHYGQTEETKDVEEILKVVRGEKGDTAYSLRG